MTDIHQYTPLRTITSYALDEENKSIGSEDKVWLLGLRALTDLNYEIAAQPKTVELLVSDNKTAMWPTDCLSWAKIGLIDEHGELNALKINNAITNYRALNPNRISDLAPQIETGIGNFPIIPFFNYYYSGNCYQLFGYKNGLITYGDCAVDEQQRVIMFPPNFKYASVLFEYISAPERDVDYQVPTVLQEAVIMFIRWKLKLASAEDYYAECIKARRRLPNKRFVLQSFNQVIRESQAMKLKA
jgi:hypothetical protein